MSTQVEEYTGTSYAVSHGRRFPAPSSDEQISRRAKLQLPKMAVWNLIVFAVIILAFVYATVSPIFILPLIVPLSVLPVVPIVWVIRAIHAARYDVALRRSRRLELFGLGGAGPNSEAEVLLLANHLEDAARIAEILVRESSANDRIHALHLCLFARVMLLQGNAERARALADEAHHLLSTYATGCIALAEAQIACDVTRQETIDLLEAAKSRNRGSLFLRLMSPEQYITALAVQSSAFARLEQFDRARRCLDAALKGMTEAKRSDFAEQACYAADTLRRLQREEEAQALLEKAHRGDRLGAWGARAGKLLGAVEARS